MTMIEKVEFIKDYYNGKAEMCLTEIERCKNGILIDVECKHPNMNSIASSAELAKKYHEEYMIYADVVAQLTALLNAE